MPDPELTEAMIRKAIQRAEKAMCPPADQRCHAFPYDATATLAGRMPADWCRIGWMAADSGRKS